MIRVLLIDDDPTCREGLRQLLSLNDDIRVVGEAASVEEAFAACRRLRPDVVLLDADLPAAVCAETMVGLSSGPGMSDRSSSVICLAVYPDQHDAAIQAGAARFLRKDGSARELLEAVRSASAGGPVLPLDCCGGAGEGADDGR